MNESEPYGTITVPSHKAPTSNHEANAEAIMKMKLVDYNELKGHTMVTAGSNSPPR
jgi:hypothetical protein